MKIKKLYVIRHGETDFNRQLIVQGSGVDSSLNKLGQTQAQHFFEAYKDFPFDKVYISALKRTRESVNNFIEKGLPYEVLTGLNEISWGIYEGQKHTKTFEEEYQQRVIDWKNGLLHIPISGGETPIDLQARQKEALEQILKNENEDTVLICMHGRALKS
ncbi:MAG: histidine phosphatase family protein, partial [Bacteroidetes bacterium]|nr:histidine phosphatase family protein [Bacteroidota bacterium]